MNYEDLMTQALKGRSVLEAAKDWGIPQPTLRKYVRGERIPDYQTAEIIRREAEVDAGTVLRIFAEQEATKKPRGMFAEIGFGLAAILVSVNLFLTPDQANAHEINALRILTSQALYVM
jgi:hypothetical protein